jgi:hypothetical protein
MTDFDKIYIVHRPPLGALSVIDISGETLHRKILATTLQGLINRSSARIYVLDGDANDPSTSDSATDRGAALYWLEYYRDQYGLTPQWQGGLDDALTRFAPEVKGYVLASDAEPWTLGAATTVAGQLGAIVAFDTEQAEVEALGLQAVDTVVGQWTNASDCYTALFAQRYSKMPHPGLALVDPTREWPRDLLVQQGIFTVWATVSLPEWPAVLQILQSAPPNVPVYGYVATNAYEEFPGVQALSQARKFLVPSDTTWNLSFHLAVVPDSALTAIPAWKPPAAQSCGGGVDLSIALTDADNLSVELIVYAWPTYWRSPSRGQLPMGWSFSPALPVLAPAVADYYQSTATPLDEPVLMAGPGYVYPDAYPDKTFVYGQTFQDMTAWGLSTYWILDVQLPNPTDPGWSALTRNATATAPKGVLLGYFNLGTPGDFRAGTIPVLDAASQYSDTPTVLASRAQAMIQAGQSAPALLSAAIWTNTVDGLVSQLAPFESNGARFLSPGSALQCVP